MTAGLSEARRKTPLSPRRLRVSRTAFWPFLNLLSLCESDGNLQRLAVAEHGDVDDVADFAAAESVREVVQVLDRFIAELDQHVAGPQSGFGCGRSRAGIGEADAVFILAKVGEG